MNFAEFVVRNREAEARIAEAANWKARAQSAESALAIAQGRVAELEAFRAKVANTATCDEGLKHDADLDATFDAIIADARALAQQPSSFKGT